MVYLARKQMPAIEECFRNWGEISGRRTEGRRASRLLVIQRDQFVRNPAYKAFSPVIGPPGKARPVIRAI